MNEPHIWDQWIIMTDSFRYYQLFMKEYLKINVVRDNIHTKREGQPQGEVFRTIRHQRLLRC
ncbi:hypothetical protein A3735_17725 [Oleiphilus sp. HI0061]|nr:hypothetical protein A3729_06945 [Oleiphilus sp. HI0043]KZY58474.1 hypothetical protein A3735_17725 [Oleiphilus sp. HI0061]KZZ62609.1 hypothetical protein A3763_07775 [Oleiphilus sp. HI0128]